MADYTGGASGAALQNQDVSNSLAHQQTAAILNAMRQMAMQQEMRQQQARGPAMEQLAGLFGGAGAPPRAPMVPPPPGTLAGGPQPPPPGTGSVPMGMPPAGATGAVPPPPMAGGGMPKPAAAPIQPFRPLPPSGDSPTNMSNIPQPGAGGGGGIPPPPAEAPPAAAAPADTGPPGIGQAKLREAIASVSKLPMTSAQKMDVLDQMMPVLNKAEQQELAFYKVQTATLTATEKYYRDMLRDNWEKEKLKQGEKRLDQGDRRLDISETKGDQRHEEMMRSNDIKERRMLAALNGIGGGKVKGVEYIYPKNADGKPDETQAPIGTRGTTATGKIIYMDADGNQVQASALEGGTAKEGKNTKVSGQATVRANLVKSGVTNALARLGEIEKEFPDTNTSSFFGTHGDNPATRATYGAGRSLQSSGQKKADAQWASLIDEAIPVFTGGLRGSDAFRRFLIEQAPGPGDDKASRAEKIRLLRANINGTSKAFFNKFVDDTSMHAPGTKPEDIEAAKGGGAAGGGESKTIGGKTYVKKNGQWFEQ